MHEFRITIPGSGSTTYQTRIASSPADVRAAQALRFQVFNLELNEGLEQSYATGLDSDPFDDVCDHLIAEDLSTGAVVGTYRLQTGRMATANRGYYSAQEFDFSPFERHRPEIVELGRACVAREHRNMSVVQLLWRGLAFYARVHNARYFIGCSSVTSTDPRDGASMYLHLSSRHLCPAEWQTKPLPAYHCPMDEVSGTSPKVPRLLAAYLALGARICGPPALDRHFKTIDFLTLLDLQSLPPHIVGKYLNSVPDFAPALRMVT